MKCKKGNATSSIIILFFFFLFRGHLDDGSSILFPPKLLWQLLAAQIPQTPPQDVDGGIYVTIPQGSTTFTVGTASNPDRRSEFIRDNSCWSDFNREWVRRANRE